MPLGADEMLYEARQHPQQGRTGRSSVYRGGNHDSNIRVSSSLTLSRTVGPALYTFRKCKHMVVDHERHASYFIVNGVLF